LTQANIPALPFREFFLTPFFFYLSPSSCTSTLGNPPTFFPPLGGSPDATCRLPPHLALFRVLELSPYNFPHLYPLSFVVVTDLRIPPSFFWSFLIFRVLPSLFPPLSRGWLTPPSPLCTTVDDKSLRLFVGPPRFFFEVNSSFPLPLPPQLPPHYSPRTLS